jgi:SpoVK/Ycf46/Vps4 family AAA+-type ATPase
VPHDLTGDQLAQLASHTAGLSGADIEELVTDAKRRAARRDAQNVSIEDFPSAEGAATERNDTETEPITDRDLNDSNEVDPFPEGPFDDDPTAGFR